MIKFYDKDLARSFLFMWDMMVNSRRDNNIQISAYQYYRDGAYAIFWQLFGREMDYYSEIEKGIVNHV